MPAAETVMAPIGLPDLLAAVTAAAGTGLVVVDRTLPDMPIVFADDGFCRLTGYAREKVLGRNCRFLQGPGTDPRAVAAIRRAIQRAEACTVELLNYRRDGSPFWNAVSLAPVGTGRPRFFIALQQDVTARRQAEQGRANEQAQLKAVIDIAVDGIVMMDEAGTLREFNPAAERIFGHRREAVLGRALGEVIVPAHLRSAHEAGLKRLVDGGPSRLLGRRIEIEGCHRDGGTVPIELTIGEVAMGSTRLFVGFIRDISARRQAEAEMRQAGERTALALAAGRMGTWEWDALSDRIVWDEAQHRLFGVAPGEAPVTLEAYLALVAPEDRGGHLFDGGITRAAERGETYESEYRIIRPDGVVRWIAEHGVGTLDGSGRMVRATGVNYDITDRKEAEAKVRDLALRDPLTGLPNRRMLQELLARDLASAVRDGQSPALMLVDLDDFKAVNDTLGHSSGDTLLVEAGHRLQACLRAGDLVARLGGDEFAILSRPGADPGGLGALASRIVAELGRPFLIGGVRVQLGASIGVAVHPGASGSVETLLSQADLALYAAKAAGRGTWRIFHPAMQERARQAVALDRDLRLALHRGEFRLFFQPLISLADFEVLGFEALLRWESPTRGMVLPGEFLPTVERGRLTVPLTFWTLSEALRQTAAWRAEGLGPARVSVNVAASALTGNNLLFEHVGVRLRAEGLEPEALLIELTEDALADGGDAVAAVLATFRAAGIKVAIDDFGAGHSSLARLRQLPLDLLKIDRAFLTGGGTKEEAILRAVVELASSLGLLAVAEGVETPEQLALLRRVGAHAAQGYLLSRPMPAEEVVAWSRAWAEQRRHDPGCGDRLAGVAGR